MGEMFAGRYELVDSLGHGGMSNVFRAWDHRERRYVAAKVLRQSDASELMRFVREQSYRIQHPHVVTPWGWAGEDDRVLFTMPVVRGGSVATLLGDFGRLPSVWVAVLLDQVLDALSEVHAAGLVHRDVKPANLLLEPTGPGRPHLRLSDFGVAARVDEPRLTRSSEVLGTPGYFSPERLLGAPPHPSQDVYAAGVVGVEMVTGSPPEPSGAPTSDRPEGCADDLWQLLCEMSGTDPDSRPTAAAARERLTAHGLLTASPRGAGHASGSIEVFDHVPALPGGWSEHGPVRGAAGSSGVAPQKRPADWSEPPPSPGGPAVSAPPNEPHRAPERPAARTGSPGWLPVVLAAVGTGLLVTAVVLLLLALP